MYLICNFSIKLLACVVFDPDCPKRSYGVNNTGEYVDKKVPLNIFPLTENIFISCSKIK